MSAGRHRLAEREQRLDERPRRQAERARKLAETETSWPTRREELGRARGERQAMLERVAGLTADQAKSELVREIENQAKREAALIVREIEGEARKEGEKRATQDRHAGGPARGHRADRRVRRLRPAPAG